jgi:transposase
VNRRRSSSKEDKLANIIKIIVAVLVDLGVPEYSSERSNRLYSVHAKIGLLVIKQHMGCSFRMLCEFLTSTPRVLRAAGMRYIPDHSTLVKFSSSLDPSVLDRILNAVALKVCREDIVMAVDSTGFSCSNASKHYIKRMKEIGCRIVSVRNYTKATLAVDTDTLMIMACETSVSTVHDVKHVPAILDKVASGKYDVGRVVMDRGYDSEKVHVQIRERLNADAVIPVRNMTERFSFKNEPRRGKNRKRMASSFPSEIYRRRPLIETANSMIKRNMGDVVYCLSDESRHKEVMCRCIAHNMRRMLNAAA